LFPTQRMLIMAIHTAP